MKCIVKNCSNRKRSRKPGVSFHRFPRDDLLKSIWISSIGCTSGQLNENTVVCSEHFLSEHIINVTRRTMLIHKAVPVLNLSIPDTFREDISNITEEYSASSSNNLVSFRIVDNETTEEFAALTNEGSSISQTISNISIEDISNINEEYSASSSNNFAYFRIIDNETAEFPAVTNEGISLPQTITDITIEEPGSQAITLVDYIDNRNQEKQFTTVVRQMDTTSWTPTQIIDYKDHDDFNYAIIVLNTKITVPEKLTCSLWQNAKYRVLVDGGVNQWLSFVHDRCIDASKLKEPDLINGDFDSVSEDSLDLFRNGNTIIEHTPEQDETDFTKAIRLLEPIVKAKQLTSIITIQEHGSRLDQIMANINTLYKASEILNNTHMYLISGGSLTWLLNPGKHSIRVPLDLVEDERWCAMIPLSGKARVTTKGFKWDLENGELEFGKLVSTSNTYASENLEITTDTFLLWSMGVFQFD